MALDATVGDNGSVFVWANRCLFPGGGNSVLRLQKSKPVSGAHPT